MSHVVDEELTFTDLDALEKAAKECGLVLRRGQRTYDWYGRWMNDFHGSHAAVSKGRDPREFGKCEHALRLEDHRPGDYEIGLVKREDGKGWDAIYDAWGSGGQKLEKAGGKHLDRLAQMYGAEVAMKKLRRLGFKKTQTYVNAQGELELTMRRGN